jgi:phage shock protein A
MANILERFSSIIQANINALLDKAEDPAKMVDQYLLELNQQLAEVKENTAAVMAESTRCSRLARENEKEIERYETLAKRALTVGNETDAKTFLTKKQELLAKQQQLQQTAEIAEENARKIRQMHDKLVNDINTLNSRKETIKAKTAVAKTQETITKTTSKTNTSDITNAFARMEAKADQMLDKANAMAELNNTPTDPTQALEEKYKATQYDALVEQDLERLKQEMGI